MSFNSLHSDRQRRIFTQSDQGELTAQKALCMLMEGNRRYVEDRLTNYHHLVQIPKASKGQWPKAIVLSCVDSRVPVEMVFDQGIGDIFVARVAGNFANIDIIGSMEFACAAAHSKLVLVLGHESCGAIKAAADVFGGTIENPDPLPANLAEMLKALKPAVEQTGGFEGDRQGKNADFVAAVVEKNVRLTMEKIRNESKKLREMEKKGEIEIRGAVYSLTTGAVTFLS